MVQSLMFFSMSSVAIAIIYSFHYKHVSIIRMVGGDSHSVFHFCFYAFKFERSGDSRHRIQSHNSDSIFDAMSFRVRTISKFVRWPSLRERSGTRFEVNLIAKPVIFQAYPSLNYLFENPKHLAYAYDPTEFPVLGFIFRSLTVLVSRIQASFWKIILHRIHVSLGP